MIVTSKKNDTLASQRNFLKRKRKINRSFLRHDTDDSLPEILIALLFFLLHVAYEAQYARV